VNDLVALAPYQAAALVAPAPYQAAALVAPGRRPGLQRRRRAAGRNRGRPTWHRG